MFLITITYGTPTDTAAFEAYYHEHHLPLATRIPHLKALSAGTCRTLDGTAPAAYRHCVLTFETEEDAAAALNSEQGRAAAADLASFATGGATLTYTAVDFTFPHTATL